MTRKRLFLKKSKLIGFALNLACILFFIAGCSNHDDGNEVIKIGFIGPLTGDSAQLGTNAKAAAELAVAEINNAGGISGKNVKLIVEDGGCDEKKAHAAASKLLKIDDVPIIIGSICSRETMSFAPMAETMERLVISYCTSAPALRFAGDYIFRTTPNAKYQGNFGANYLLENGYKKVGILGCNDHWCSGIADAFESEYAKSGDVLARESFHPGTTDLRTEILKLREEGVDAIYFVARASSTIAGMKQIQDLGWDVFLFGADTWDDISVKGKHPNAKYSTIHLDLPKSFVNQLRNAGFDATVCAPQAYDTVKIVANMLQQSNDPTHIKEMLYAMPTYSGISGDIQFDEYGDIMSGKYIAKDI